VNALKEYLLRFFQLPNLFKFRHLKSLIVYNGGKFRQRVHFVQNHQGRIFVGYLNHSNFDDYLTLQFPLNQEINIHSDGSKKTIYFTAPLDQIKSNIIFIRFKDIAVLSLPVEDYTRFYLKAVAELYGYDIEEKEKFVDIKGNDIIDASKPEGVVIN